MKLMRVGPVGSETPVVLDAQGRRRDVSSITADFDGAFFGSGGIERLRAADLATLPVVADDLRVGAPIARPGNVLCVGLNYIDHANESKMQVPVEPVLFNKAPNAVVGPNDDVRMPRGATKVDWEVELGVVIGSTCRYLGSAEESLAHVAGFVISNDVSERAFQLEGTGQWVKGKSCETFNPCGPWLVTPDEVDLGAGLDLWLDVNGERRQTGHTSDLIFDVAFLLHYISQYLVLDPGDLVNTGTPPGVAMGMPEPAWLRPGDEMVLGISGLGEQRQRCVPAP
jgi:2-keto-4-pentenoate hydratase/2-oxohepta-3-ene-1,7-dioic acid hydratase in catechol pathway